MKQEAQNPCEKCEQKELCPVYMGQNCILVCEHKEEIAAYDSRRDSPDNVGEFKPIT